MNNESKNLKEQVVSHINHICNSGEYDISFDEFDATIGLVSERYHIPGSLFVCENEWVVMYKVKLTEKYHKFSSTVYGSVDLEHLAKVAVFRYLQAKEKYLKDLVEETNNTHSHISFFGKIKDRFL